MAHAATGQLLVQLASYNTNLQGFEGVPQDLVDWLSPTLQVSSFLSRSPRAPDIVAVGFQELLPLHLGLAGLSNSVVKRRREHILSEIEANAPNKESFTLIANVVNGGVALLVYAKDEGIARKVSEVETAWTGCGPCYMGNKGAVGVRFRVRESEQDMGETYTFVCAHLTAHEEYLPRRIWDYHHIVGTLLFSPLPGSADRSLTTIYSTSHLFFMGDLNFRVSLPDLHPLAISLKPNYSEALETEQAREEIKEYDQLLVEHRKGTVFVGLREAEFWKFKCSYKYILGEADRYNNKRTPSWTDRILYTTYTDSADSLDKSNINSILYTSIPGYTTSDHKPIVALLLLPPRTTDSHSSIPLIRLPAEYNPRPYAAAVFKRYIGRVLDRIIGILWWLLSLFGAGSAVVGVFNFLVGLGAWSWWRSSASDHIQNSRV